MFHGLCDRSLGYPRMEIGGHASRPGWSRVGFQICMEKWRWECSPFDACSLVDLYKTNGIVQFHSYIHSHILAFHLVHLSAVYRCVCKFNYASLIGYLRPIPRPARIVEISLHKFCKSASSFAVGCRISGMGLVESLERSRNRSLGGRLAQTYLSNL
jgi:hypothetical protein